MDLGMFSKYLGIFHYKPNFHLQRDELKLVMPFFWFKKKMLFLQKHVQKRFFRTTLIPEHMNSHAEYKPNRSTFVLDLRVTRY